MCLIDATAREKGARVALARTQMAPGVESAVRRFDSARAGPTVRAVITLTPRAAQRVRTMQTELAAPAKRLRVFVESGGCSGFQYGMSFDEQKDGDAEFVSEGVPLLIDATSLAYLDGSAIDFDDGLHGKGFEIKNPNAQSTCGCGKSFG